MGEGILSAEDVNAMEDWVSRLERARDDMVAAASRMETAGAAMGHAGTRMTEAAGTMYSAASRVGA